MLHNAIRDPRFFRGYADHVDLDEGKGVERLGETLTPVLDFDSRPELAALKGEALWWANFQSPAIAAQNSYGGILARLLTNAAGTVVPYVTTIEGWEVTPRNPGTLIGTMDPITAAGGTRAPAHYRDVRFFLGGQDAVPNIDTFFNAVIGLPAGANFVYNCGIQSPAAALTPFILPPNQVLAFWGSAVNTALSANIWGRVRRATPAEIRALRL